MNIQSPIDGNAREAKLRYLPGDYMILSPGNFVRCAITGKAVPLEELRYWSAEVQEAYASPEIAVARYEQLKAEGKL